MTNIKEDPHKFLDRICDNIKDIEEEEEEEKPVSYYESEEYEHVVYDDPNRTPQY